MSYLSAIFGFLFLCFLSADLQTNIKCDMRFLHVKFLSSPEDNVLVSDIHCKESQIV